MSKKKKGPHGECKSLSKEEIAALQKEYTPPLSAKEIFEKQMRDAVKPDMSHLTVYDPSKRR